MISLLFSRLPGFRILLCVIAVLAIGESGLAAYSIAMLVPIVQVLLTPDATAIGIPGLPKAVNAWLAQLGLGWTFVVFGLIVAAKVGVTYGRAVLEAHLGRVLRNRWNLGLCRHYILQPYRYTAGSKQGAIINILVRDVLRANNFVTANLAFFASTTYVLAMAVMVTLADWRVPLAVVGLGAVAYVLVLRPLLKFSRQNGTALQGMTQALAASVADSISGLKDIKVLNIESMRLNDIAQQTEETGRREFRYTIVQDLPLNLTEAAFAIVMLAAGSVLVTKGPLDLQGSLPTALFFLVAIYKLMGQVANVASQRVKIVNREPSFKTICDMSDQPIEAENLTDGESVTSLDTDIRFRGVHFSHRAPHPVLVDLSIDVERGRTTFIYGPSGAGKSTLLDLLTRLQDPDSGTIEANGRNIGAFRLADWRRLFGYVGQEPYLFHGTILDNIRLDVPSLSNEDVQQAATLAGAHDFIAKLSDGYDTVVRERGSNFSGGQRRRIALARALVRKPSVVILDEATSAVEIELEREILSSLRQSPDLTVIVVTHRHENEDLADVIYRVEGGKAHRETDRRAGQR